MLKINKYKKCITVELNEFKYKDNEIEFTQEQINFIKEKKIFVLYYYTKKLITNIPNNITHLIIQERNFNQDICKYLPNNLLHIEFCQLFDFPVDNLPSKLSNIQFGWDFNQDVRNLPDKLKRLQFGYHFNKSVDHLPSSIQVLIFGHSFNQDVSNLPSNIIYIQFGCAFSQSIDNLPNSIQIIKFSVSNNYENKINKLPSNLKKIKLPWNYEPVWKLNAEIPESIENIIISGCDSHISATFYYIKENFNTCLYDNINKITYDNLYN